MEPTAEEARQNAKLYWAASLNSFLASNDYYDRVEATLTNDIIHALPKSSTVLDVGCGSGRFTLLLANHTKHVEAYDLGPQLIAEAHRAAEARGVSNVSFHVADMDDALLPNGPFDLIVCMGVLSTMLDNGRVEHLVAQLVQRIAAGGHLLLRESLSVSDIDEELRTASPPAKYRSKQLYARMLVRAGLVPIVCAKMKTWSKQGRENYLMLMRRRKRYPWAGLRFRLNPLMLFETAIDRTK